MGVTCSYFLPFADTGFETEHVSFHNCMYTHHHIVCKDFAFSPKQGQESFLVKWKVKKEFRQAEIVFLGGEITAQFP